MIRRRDAAVLGVLSLVSAAVPLYLVSHLDLTYPAGSDQDLWGLSALNYRVGARMAVPPLYPALVNLVEHLLGADLAHCAGGVSAALTVFWAPLAWVAARALGAGRAFAVVAAVASLAVPQAIIFALQAQPDQLTVILALAAVAVGAAWTRRPNWWSGAGLAVLAALAPLVREHGLVVAVLLVGLAGVAPGRRWQRGLRVAAVVAAIVLGPLLLGLAPGIPWEQSWYGRLSEPMRSTEQTQLPKYALSLPSPLRSELAGYFQEEQAAMVRWFFVKWAFRHSPWGWALLLGATAGSLLLPRGRRLAPWVALLAAVPTLVVWSQPRHVAVVVPVAVVVAGALASRALRGRHFVAAGLVSVATGGALAAQWGEWPELALRCQGQSRMLVRRAEFGKKLCEVVVPGALGAGERWSFLFCPLPQNKPGSQGTAADWKTYWVVSRPESAHGEGRARGLENLARYRPRMAGWALIELESTHYEVFRLAPWVPDGERPCAASRPAPDTPYLNHPIEPARMEPPCEEPWPSPPEDFDRSRLASASAGEGPEEGGQPKPPPGAEPNPPSGPEGKGRPGRPGAGGTEDLPPGTRPRDLKPPPPGGAKNRGRNP